MFNNAFDNTFTHLHEHNHSKQPPTLMVRYRLQLPVFFTSSWKGKHPSELSYSAKKAISGGQA